MYIILLLLPTCLWLAFELPSKVSSLFPHGSQENSEISFYKRETIWIFNRFKIFTINWGNMATFLGWVCLQIMGWRKILFISESQSKVYQITKYHLNQNLSFSTRSELFKMASQNKNAQFSFVVQLDIVFWAINHLNLYVHEKPLLPIYFIIDFLFSEYWPFCWCSHEEC